MQSAKPPRARSHLCRTPPCYVRRARFLLPEGVGTIPFRAVAQSDDLPEELFEVREDFLLRLGASQPGLRREPL